MRSFAQLAAGCRVELGDAPTPHIGAPVRTAAGHRMSTGELQHVPPRLDCRRLPMLPVTTEAAGSSSDESASASVDATLPSMRPAVISDWARRGCRRSRRSTATSSARNLDRMIAAMPLLPATAAVSAGPDGHREQMKQTQWPYNIANVHTLEPIDTGDDDDDDNNNGGVDDGLMGKEGLEKGLKLKLARF